MKKCEHKRVHCYDSRRYKTYRWRRYKCLDCEYRFTTVELPVDLANTSKIKNAEMILREKFGMTQRQQAAIGELIQSFLVPEDEER